MMDQQTLSTLLKADIYRLLAYCFDFPTEDRLSAIKEMAEALSESGYADEKIVTTINTLSGCVDRSEILDRYTFIFIKGGVPLSESHTLQRFTNISDVNAFYNAFGFSPKSGDNPNSIMYELEFLALLLVKIAMADNVEAASISYKAYQDFLNEHAAEFALALSKRIREGACGTYFLTVSYLLEAFIASESSCISKSSEEGYIH